jgi:hypothetical protein
MVLEAIRNRDCELARRLVAEFHRWANEKLREAADEARNARNQNERKL